MGSIEHIRCRTCQYYVVVDPLVPDQGECRRRAPCFPGNGASAGFPFVREGCWCGEWLSETLAVPEPVRVRPAVRRAMVDPFVESDDAKSEFNDIWLP
ncbi:MAG: hypothetical protein AB7S61_01295 [Methanoregulaceae archaeon]